MSKAYVIARATVTDPDQWATYATAAAAAMKKYGATPLARGGRHEIIEGDGRPRNVILEFASYDQAIAYVHSQEYGAARKLREHAGKLEMVVVEGV